MVPNGGEGAAVEYAVHALGIKEVIVCGHSLWSNEGIAGQAGRMPLVYDWLKHAEATRRTISENYKDKEGEDLLQATIEENVPPSLRTCGLHPVIHPDFSGQIHLHAWVYHIETVLNDAVRGNYLKRVV